MKWKRVLQICHNIQIKIEMFLQLNAILIHNVKDNEINAQ